MEKLQLTQLAPSQVVEFWALTHVYRPPEHPWSAIKTVASFMALTFLSMLVSMLPAIVWMMDIRKCGPFESIRPIDAPGAVHQLVCFRLYMHCRPYRVGGFGTRYLFPKYVPDDGVL